MTGDDTSVDFFLCYTPYQMLLSHAVACEIPDGHQRLYVIPAFDTAEAARLCDLLRASGTFTRVELLPGKFDGDEKRETASQRQVIRENIDYLYGIIAECEPRRTFASVDTKEIVQAVMSHTPHNVYIEDGSAAYISQTTGWCSYRTELLNKLVYRLRCGFWWESIDIYGTSSYIDEVWAVYPDHRRPELGEYPARQILKKPLLQLAQTDQFQEYLGGQGICEEELEDIDGLLLLSHSIVLQRTPEYREVLETFVDRASDSDINFAVKFHSRDTEVKRFPETLLKEFLPVPRNMPAELLYARRPQVVDYIVGYQSTALYTAQWLYDDVHMASIGRLINDSDQQLLEFFEDIGIAVPQTHEALSEQFL
jgi:hypothetical protein